MSGSPVLDRNERVIGTVGLGSLTSAGQVREQHGQPVPLTNLPGWLLADLQPCPLPKLATHMNALARDYDARVRRRLKGFRASVSRRTDSGQLGRASK